jgi:hypothetical protein
MMSRRTTMKILGLASVYEDKYENIQYGRGGWMGRNVTSGVHESLPSNAIVVYSVEQAFPELLSLVEKRVEEKVGVEVKKQLDVLLSEAENAGKSS